MDLRRSLSRSPRKPSPLGQTTSSSQGPPLASSSSSPASASSELPSQPLLRHLVESVGRLSQASLPSGSGHLVLSCIFSPPRINKVLYPWAHLDDPRAAASGSRPYPSHPTQTWEEMIFFHVEWRSDKEDEDDAKMIMAIEAYNYTLPEQGAGVFYLSKLDTTGWGPRLESQRVQSHLIRLQGQDPAASSTPATTAPSLTGYLTSQFLAYFMQLRHLPPLPVECLALKHISLHVLARAQGAYIFPNSPDNPAKKPLSDNRLIIWWRQTISQVVALIKQREEEEQSRSSRIAASPLSMRDHRSRIDAYYMIPGMDKLESHPLVPIAPSSGSSALAQAQWRYGHPYTTLGATCSSEQDLPPLPLFLEGPHSKIRSVATLLPRFEDDPHSRFMDEIAGEGQEIAKSADLLRRPVRSAPSTSIPSKINNPLAAAPPPRAEPSIAPIITASGSRNSSAATTASNDSSSSCCFSSQLEANWSQTTAASSVYDSQDEASGPQTPSKKLKRTRSGAESPYNDGTSASTPPPDAMSSGVRTRSSVSPRKTPVSSPSKVIAAAVRSPPAKLGTSQPTRATTTAPRLNQTQLQALRSRLALDNVSLDDFWARMGFRQECSSGNLVGIFFLGVTAAETAASPAIVPAHPAKPRFTIPVTSLQKAVRTELQLDDCWWNRPRDAIECTQYFDEERGRLLCHLGRLTEEEKREATWPRGDHGGIMTRSKGKKGKFVKDQEKARKNVGSSKLESSSPTKRPVTSRGSPVILTSPARSSPKSPSPRKRSNSDGTDDEGLDKKEVVINSADEMMEWIWRVGQGIVWKSCRLQGFSQSDVDQCRAMVAKEDEQVKQESENRRIAAGGAAGFGGVKDGVTMLTVKRKRKA